MGVGVVTPVAGVLVGEVLPGRQGVAVVFEVPGAPVPFGVAPATVPPVAGMPVVGVLPLTVPPGAVGLAVVPPVVASGAGLQGPATVLTVELGDLFVMPGPVVIPGPGVGLAEGVAPICPGDVVWLGVVVVVWLGVVVVV